jgi:hypothetical protein
MDDEQIERLKDRERRLKWDALMSTRRAWMQLLKRMALWVLALGIGLNGLVDLWNKLMGHAK